MLKESQLNNLNNQGWCVVKNVIPNSVQKLIIEESLSTEKRFLNDWSKNNPQIKFDVNEFSPLNRLRHAWLIFNRPSMRRYPHKYLITRNFHKFVSSKIFVDIAKQILNQDEIALFGSFNLRVKIKEQSWNQTKAHADWQAWRVFSDGHILSLPDDFKVFTFWTPLNQVDKNSSCLRLSNYQLSLESDSFLNKKSLSIEESNFFKDINFIDIKLSPKDLLIFNHKVIHCSNPNLTESVIWAADWRYQKLGEPIEGMKYGFKIPNSYSSKSLEKSFNDWSQKISNYTSFY